MDIILQFMSINFTFPNNREQLEYIEGIQQLREQLKKQRSLNIYLDNNFRVELRANGRYIYARCKNCKACLRYKWLPEQERYQLRGFNNQHQHLYSANLNKQLEQFITDLPMSIELATARKIATAKFNISSSKFYHTYSKIKKDRSTFADLIKELEKRDYDVSLDPFPVPVGEIPNIIVVISPKMKENFMRYGQCVSYDLTYNLIQDVTQKRSQYAVGIFTGVNCYNKIIPFGISITCQQTTEAFCKIFQTFIECCGAPKSFITDQQKSMASAIDRLRQNQIFKGVHLIDSFHVIRNFGKISGRKDLLKIVSELIKQENAIVFDIKLEEFQKQLSTEEQLKAFKLFYNKRRYVCFSQIPRDAFLIFNSSNSINEKMNDLIKSRIRSQKSYSKVLRILVEFGENLAQTSKQSIELYDSKLQEIFQDSELKLCRYLLARRPMQQFLKQYVSSLSLRQPLTEGDTYVFQEQYNTFACSFGETFDCTCDLTLKTGIGCRHMIWICRKFKFNYMQVIHKRWKFDSQAQNKKKERSNRTTRRRK